MPTTWVKEIVTDSGQADSTMSPTSVWNKELITDTIQGAQLTVDNINIDGNTITTTSGYLDLDSALNRVDIKANFISDGDYTCGGNITVSGGTILSSGNITSSGGTITASGNLAGANLALTSGGNISCNGTVGGTLTTAAQPNITSLGTLTSLTVDGIVINGNLIGTTEDADLINLHSGGGGLITVSGILNASTLAINGTHITATATELNLIDGAQAGVVVNSKAVIYKNIYFFMPTY